jgi:Xaa-Pro aminopeptidase
MAPLMSRGPGYVLSIRTLYVLYVINWTRQHFGTPNAEEKRAFTRVLQGHIAIDNAIFPNGTTGQRT